MKSAVEKFPDFVDFDNELNARLCYNVNRGDGSKKGLIIFYKDENINNSYHYDLISLGFAKLDEKANLTEILNPLKIIEEKAKKEKLGVWGDYEALDYDEDEDNY